MSKPCLPRPWLATFVLGRAFAWFACSIRLLVLQTRSFSCGVRHIASHLSRCVFVQAEALESSDRNRMRYFQAPQEAVGLPRRTFEMTSFHACHVETVAGLQRVDVDHLAGSTEEVAFGRVLKISCGGCFHSSHFLAIFRMSLYWTQDRRLRQGGASAKKGSACRVQLAAGFALELVFSCGWGTHGSNVRAGFASPFNCSSLSLTVNLRTLSPKPESHGCPLWSYWWKNRWRFLVYLVV